MNIKNNIKQKERKSYAEKKSYATTKQKHKDATEKKKKP